MGRLQAGRIQSMTKDKKGCIQVTMKTIFQRKKEEEESSVKRKVKL